MYFNFKSEVLSIASSLLSCSIGQNITGILRICSIAWWRICLNTTFPPGPDKCTPSGAEAAQSFAVANIIVSYHFHFWPAVLGIFLAHKSHTIKLADPWKHGTNSWNSWLSPRICTGGWWRGHLVHNDAWLVWDLHANHKKQAIKGSKKPA